jgi:hypothetical protein
MTTIAITASIRVKPEFDDGRLLVAAICSISLVVSI